ncbi:hypothetical protein SESBI_12941 [Sesbania bispinosa]|nr:hypothetical protein SESBI_12941 [Sesbania bispinosa]
MGMVQVVYAYFPLDKVSVRCSIASTLPDPDSSHRPPVRDALPLCSRAPRIWPSPPASSPCSSSSGSPATSLQETPSVRARRLLLLGSSSSSHQPPRVRHCNVALVWSPRSTSSAGSSTAPRHHRVSSPRLVSFCGPCMNMSMEVVLFTGMLNPSANSKLKRKRVEKQTRSLTIFKDEEKNVEKEEIASDNGLLSTPMVHSPQYVRSPAIFILDNASLKKGLVRKNWKILNSDEDAQFLLKQKKNLNDYRPDIIHEALRCILDSPLNKAGLVGGIYVKIDQGAMFEVKPHVHIPRTCKRFCGVILELLQKSSVRAKDTNEVLLRVVEEPITRHLPVNSHIVGLSYTSEKLVDIEEHVSVWNNDLSPVFVVGAMVNGKVKRDYVHDYISDNSELAEIEKKKYSAVITTLSF